MIVSKTFKSEQSHDIIDVSYHQKSHNATFILKQIDKVTDNIKLVNEILVYLKQNDIKWIVIPNVKFAFKIPENTVWFKNKYNNNIHVHIEDFEKFYLQNLSSLIKTTSVHMDPKVDNDGWIKVIDPKKEKKQKIARLNNDITSFMDDWLNL